ncbi:MAG: PilZ domain-containing protein [Myxococcota bacterium]
MEKRRTHRTKHRLTCEIIVDRQSHPAVVRDLAPTGLFVQTRQRPAPNSVVEVRFPEFAGLPAFTIEAGVARHRNVHPRLQTEIQSGIGLEILGRPEPYLALASRVVAPKAGLEAGSADAAGSDRGPRSFRVRLAAHGRSHPRTITVLASSIQAARARALTQAGAGWKITEVETI